MAETLHSLAIQIQGKIDANLGDSIDAVQGYIKKLDDSVNAIADSKIKTDPITSAFVKLSAESAKAAREIEELNHNTRLIDGFKAQREATESAAKKYDEAKEALEALENQQEDTNIPGYTNKLKRARKEIIEAEKAYNKEKKTLDVLDGKLKDAGVDTEDLSEEQRKLAEKMEGTTRRSEELERSLQRLTEVKYGIQKLRGQFKQLGSDLAGVGKTWAMMGGVAFGTLYALSSSLADAGDAVDGTAEKLKMSSDAFQQLNYAAKMSGVQDFEGIMVKLNTSLAEFAKNDEGAAKLAEYGMNAEQLAKLKPENALLLIADSLNKIKDPAARARAELDLFGESGAEMGAFLSEGSDGIKELCDEAKKLGIVIPEEVTKQAAAFNEARDKMTGAFDGLKNIIGAELMPSFTELFDEITQFFVDNQPTVREFAQKLGDGFKEALPVIKDLVAGAKDFIGKVIDIGGKIVDLVGGFENLGMIIAALPLLKPLLTMVSMGKTIFDIGKSLGLVNGLVSGFSKILGLLVAHPAIAIIALIAGGAYLIYKNWDWLKEKFGPLLEPIGNVILSLKDKALGIIDTMKTGFNTLVQKFADARENFANLKNSIVEKAEELKTKFISAVASIPDKIKNALAGLKDIIMEPFWGAQKLISEKVEGIKKFFVDIPDSIKNALAGLKDIITAPFKEAFTFITEKVDSLKGAFKSIKGAFSFEASDEDKAAAAQMPKGTGGRARGGLITHPMISTFAERGPEVAVPVGMADRGLGLANLDIAARALGVGGMRGGSTITIESNPVIQVSVNGGDPNEIRNVMLEVLRDYGAKMLPEWAAQIERLSYATG
ncbi:MAG: hypothetical protein LBU13_05325 [Synergistaceae bacterium]|jgi:hypothetical protein|nr:hypothetical protein [Synergistaceae bacterium]